MSNLPKLLKVLSISSLAFFNLNFFDISYCKILKLFDIVSTYQSWTIHFLLFMKSLWFKWIKILFSTTLKLFLLNFEIYSCYKHIYYNLGPSRNLVKNVLQKSLTKKNTTKNFNFPVWDLKTKNFKYTKP